MKCLYILSILLASSFLPSVYSKTTTPDVVEHQDSEPLPTMTTQAKTTFAGCTTVKFSPRQEAFIDSMWVAAYDTVHENEEYIVDSVEVLQEHSHPATRNLRLQKLFYYDFMFLVRWSCDLCNDDDGYWIRQLVVLSQKQIRRKHRRFERLFCKMLRAGPFEDFQRVHDCRVIFMTE